MKHDKLSLDQAEALMDKIGGVDGVERLIAGTWIVSEPASPTAAGANTNQRIVAGLLRCIDDPIEVSAPRRFVARDAFVADRDGELPISLIGEDFTTHFLGLVEEDVGAATIRQRILIKGSIDRPIFDALGGPDGARIALAHVFAFLKGADRERWYFFYVADTTGNLWAVDTYWRDGGWDIEAYSVTYPRGWRGGGCVVSA